MTRQKRARERAEAEARAEAVEEDDMRRFRAAPPPPGPWQAPALTAMRLLLSAQAFLMLMLMLLVVAIVASETDAADRAPDRSRQRLDMQKHIGAMTEREFARYYRVDRQSFADIVEMITPPLPELRKRRKRGRKSSGGFVEFDLRLSMALRYLAGGSYLDIMYLHGVSLSLGVKRSPIFSYYTLRVTLDPETCVACALSVAVHTRSAVFRSGCLMSPCALSAVCIPPIIPHANCLNQHVASQRRGERVQRHAHASLADALAAATRLACTFSSMASSAASAMNLT